MSAADILDSLTIDVRIVASEHSYSYMQLATHHLLSSNISRAPCHGSLCILETSIKLLPESIESTPVASARDIFRIESARLKDLEGKWAVNYIDFAPSNAVDGESKTSFRSPESEFAF